MGISYWRVTLIARIVTVTGVSLGAFAKRLYPLPIRWLETFRHHSPSLYRGAMAPLVIWLQAHGGYLLALLLAHCISITVQIGPKERKKGKK